MKEKKGRWIGRGPNMQNLPRNTDQPIKTTILEPGVLIQFDSARPIGEQGKIYNMPEDSKVTYTNVPINYVKNLARRIKKRTGMQHHQALNEAAKEIGFDSYQLYLKSLKS